MSEHTMKELPLFETESEEAQWWFDNREALSEEFIRAIDEGRVIRRTKGERGMIRTLSIQIDPEDLSQAKILAEKKGVLYQAYLRVLIHEALQHEAKMAANTT